MKIPTITLVLTIVVSICNGQQGYKLSVTNPIQTKSETHDIYYMGDFTFFYSNSSGNISISYFYDFMGIANEPTFKWVVKNNSDQDICISYDSYFVTKGGEEVTLTHTSDGLNSDYCGEGYCTIKAGESGENFMFGCFDEVLFIDGNLISSREIRYAEFRLLDVIDITEKAKIAAETEARIHNEENNSDARTISGDNTSVTSSSNNKSEDTISDVNSSNAEKENFEKSTIDNLNATASLANMEVGKGWYHGDFNLSYMQGFDLHINSTTQYLSGVYFGIKQYLFGKRGNIAFELAYNFQYIFTLGDYFGSISEPHLGLYLLKDDIFRFGIYSEISHYNIKDKINEDDIYSDSSDVMLGGGVIVPIALYRHYKDGGIYLKFGAEQGIHPYSSFLEPSGMLINEFEISYKIQMLCDLNYGELSMICLYNKEGLRYLALLTGFRIPW